MGGRLIRSVGKGLRAEGQEDEGGSRWGTQHGTSEWQPVLPGRDRGPQHTGRPRATACWGGGGGGEQWDPAPCKRPAGSSGKWQVSSPPHPTHAALCYRCCLLPTGWCLHVALHRPSLGRGVVHACSRPALKTAGAHTPALDCSAVHIYLITWCLPPSVKYSSGIKKQIQLYCSHGKAVTCPKQWWPGQPSRLFFACQAPLPPAHPPQLPNPPNQAPRTCVASPPSTIVTLSAFLRTTIAAVVAHDRRHLVPCPEVVPGGCARGIRPVRLAGGRGPRRPSRPHAPQSGSQPKFLAPAACRQARPRGGVG